MRNIIEKSIAKFIKEIYGEDPEDACYDISELANAIASDIESKKEDVPSKPYMLLSTCERNTAIMRFQTYEDAYTQMKEEFEMFGGDEEAIEDSMAEIGEWYAWITDGNNHDNYDWQIFDLKNL